ncbi:MAG: NADP-dependent malic enzyme [Chloroflexi bacterium]|nr:NADP-dependent malic enzyme [Chloroflexota bacterium]MDA1174059.1 NADP-dependent malic enzyme [Chloroflexota bacterium]
MTTSSGDIGQRAIDLHRQYQGKLSINARMPLRNADDLSLAYTPGVGHVSMAVANDPSLSYELTGRGRTVAVVSDGSAVLGLGNLGPLGAMPVMEGKCLLFKELGGVDAVPIVLDTQDADEIVMIVKNLAPSFGGINLEDISAPRCFDIEERLQDIGIPVFHDDQHGTAIVTMAAVTNALRVVGKNLGEVKVVFSGAGAAGIACAQMLLKAGASNLILVDSKGSIYDGRPDLNHAKRDIAKVTNREGITGDIHEAIVGADVFIGLSSPGVIDREDVKRMAPDAIVLAMANPTPEIMPDEAKAGGAVVIGTGRSDFPNQVNNVLAFPGVFKGALSVRAPRVTAEMQIAAAIALANLVEVPGVENILPEALDRAVAPVIANAVAEAWRANPAR